MDRAVIVIQKFMPMPEPAPAQDREEKTPDEN